MPLQILTENQNVILTSDIFFVNWVPFLVTLSQNIRLTTTHYLKNCKPSTIAAALDQTMAIYAKLGFKVVQILMDGEFEPLHNDLNQASINLNITVANEHVPQIDNRSE